MAVPFEFGNEGPSLGGIKKAIIGEGSNLAVRCVRGVPEDRLEKRIDCCGRAVDRADVGAFANSVEESFEGAGTVGHQGFFGGAGGGSGVGVFVLCDGVHFFSIVVRIALTSAPELCISIASRATSMQIAHP